MNKTFRNYILSLLAVWAIAMVVCFTVSKTAGALIGVLGASVVVIGMMFYVAIFDSRKRWPGTTWLQRLDRMLRFQR
jgi:hypothetical protein